MSEVETWDAYYEASLTKPLHPIFAALEPYLPANGLAVDLGFGVGQGVRFLRSHGLDVRAVDSDPKALTFLALDPHVEATCEDFMAFKMPECDVVLAVFSLFFLSQSDFSSFCPNMVAKVRPGGLFAGQLLGLNDDWVKSKGCSSLSTSELKRAFKGWEFLHFEEVDRDGETILRESKHWHVYHIVARKL